MPSAASSSYLTCTVKRKFPNSVFWSADITPHKFTDGNAALIFMSAVEYTKRNLLKMDVQVWCVRFGVGIY
jgi:hypothetical protein